jgi:hypothetical protein
MANTDPRQLPAGVGNVQPTPAQPEATYAVPYAQGTVVPQAATQPAVVQQPVVYYPAAAAPAPAPSAPVLPQTTSDPNKAARGLEKENPAGDLQLKVYSHSALFYWWPVWVVGYIMAFVTYMQGEHIEIGGVREWFHPNSNLGVLYFLTLFLVILITNVTVRGPGSVIVILTFIVGALFVAYMNWWDYILEWMGSLRIHMNLGAYLSFSTLMFIVWVLTVFIFDHMSYWLIKPGQITQEFLLGSGSKSYDTEGMVLEKHRSDIFRHWVLGLGSGDLVIQTMGANRDRIDVPNVLFVGAKVAVIQRMIAIRPEEFGRATVT